MSVIENRTCASVTLSFSRRPSFSSTADNSEALICSLDIVAFLAGELSVGEKAPYGDGAGGYDGLAAAGAGWL